jgi:hypothetical protein
MSPPVKPEASDPGSPEYYAPRKLRDILADEPPFIQPQVDGNAQSHQRRSFFDRRRRVEANAPTEPFPDTLRNFMRSENGSGPTRSGRKWITVALSGAAILVGLAAATLYLEGPQPVEPQNAAVLLKDAKASLAERLQAASSALDRGPAKAAPPTVAIEDQNGTINAPLPIGIDVANPTPGATVKLSGLAPGTTVSAGIASGQGEWRIGVDDLPKALVIPPRDYVGSLAVTAELQGNNGQVVVRSRLRYAWKQPVVEIRAPVEATPPVAKPPATVKLNPPKPEASAAAGKAEESMPTRRLDPEEVALLLKRSEDLISSGDLASARLLLERVAETRNARAALELGATYDPIVIRQRGIISAAPDPALAQTWYQRARDWGSPDASKQLEALASARK